MASAEPRALWPLLAEKLGVAIREREPLGGAARPCYRLRLGDGRKAFLKTAAHDDARVFGAEARGLEFLRASNAIRVPEVLAVSARDEPAFLVLQWFDDRGSDSRSDERFGAELARLHRTPAPVWGLDHDNWLASLPQNNACLASWPDFYVERRLRPLLRRVAAGGLLGAPLEHGFERLFDGLETRLGPEERPARLHGDLWSGNYLVTERGEPCVFDPAVYGGHREIDLAMMRLFGGFSSRVFSAYAEVFPLSPGYLQRVPVYQLYPLLAHVAMFGAGYLGQLRQALERSLALPRGLF